MEKFINSSSSDIEQYILPYLDTAKIFTTTPQLDQKSEIFILVPARGDDKDW
jgi:hypothetical protein